jgi:hypothetical protein
VKEAKILASDGAPGDMFGLAVCIGGDRVFVGSSWHERKQKESGSVYVYQFGGGREIEQGHKQDAQ